MSDETSDRTHYSSSKTNRKRASSAASSSRASKAASASAGRGTTSGSRKADDPAAWAGTPGRQGAAERTHAFGKRVGW